MTDIQTTDTTTLRLQRHFTQEGIHPYDMVNWELRTARVGAPGKKPKFEQEGVEVPEFWSQNATDIVASKYFGYDQTDPRRESSVRQLIDRVVKTIATAGMQPQRETGRPYFVDEEERRIFEEELTYICLHQLGAFNSPVWFNVGKEGAAQQCSACFILSINDSLESISEWQARETRIFKRGSGSGVNLSNLRGSAERLALGGKSSGPVTFMRAADANAGTIQSGGTTRRAAKMVVLNIDHPDIEDFIWCKAREEDRIRILKAAGLEIGIGTAVGEKNLAEATAYQNANNSVRVTQEFLDAVDADGDWSLIARTTGEITKTVKARDLMHQIAEAAWRCADPGVQYDTTINDWHTTPAQGRINGSNPCSEYMSNDDTSCNLASLNLLKFMNPDGTFNVESFRHAARIMFTAQDITISFGDFPDDIIGQNSRDLRQIGIGYANLGALLMAMGLAYDSKAGRDTAAAITFLLTGESYLQSTYLAERVAPFRHYEENAKAVNRVLRKHRDAAKDLAAEDQELVKAAQAVWSETVRRAAKTGVRNAQASVLAPTGTIAFMMDCDTTGIEPDFALVKHKTLAGGGNMVIINRTVPMALRRLGYTSAQVEEIVNHILEEIDMGGFSAPRNTVVGAPHLRPEHYPVFDTATGERSISWRGHVDMMAACQPALSGAISKTVNLPETATVEDIEEAYIYAGRAGVKALAVYRDNCKAFQPLSSSKKETREIDAKQAVEERKTSILGDGLLRGERRKVARRAPMNGVNFDVGMVSGYIAVREFEDGRPGAIFIDVGQAGSTLRGFINSLAITMSLAWQHGTPLDVMVSKLAGMQFEPYGFTNDPDVRQARSLVDYIVKWLALEYLDPEVHPELGIGQARAAEQAMVQPEEIAPKTEVHAATRAADREVRDTIKLNTADSMCAACGGVLQQTGACRTCTACGQSTGGCG